MDSSLDIQTDALPDRCRLLPSETLDAAIDVTLHSTWSAQQGRNAASPTR